jgi:hypothetical protein
MNNYPHHPENPDFKNNNPKNSEIITQNQKNLFNNFDNEINNSKTQNLPIETLNKSFLNNDLNNNIIIKIKQITEEINKQIKQNNEEINKKKDYLLVINWLEIIAKVTAYNLKEKKPLQLKEKNFDDYIKKYLSSENNNQTGGFNPIIEKGKNIGEKIIETSKNIGENIINFVKKPFKPDKTQEEMAQWMEPGNTEGDINLNKNHFEDDEIPYYERKRNPEIRDSSNSTQNLTNRTSESHPSSSQESDPNLYYDEYEYLNNYDPNSKIYPPNKNKKYQNNSYNGENSSNTTQPSTESTNSSISLSSKPTTSRENINESAVLTQRKPDLYKTKINNNVSPEEFLDLFFDTIEDRLMKILNYERNDKYTKEKTKELIARALKEDEYFKKIIQNSLIGLNTQTAKGGTKTRRKQNALRHNPKRTKRRIQTPPPSLKTTKQKKQKAQYQNITRRTKNKPNAKLARKTKNNNKQ